MEVDLAVAFWKFDMVPSLPLRASSSSVTSYGAANEPPAPPAPVVADVGSPDAPPALVAA